MIFKERIKRIHHFLFRQHRRKTFAALAVLVLAYAFCLPRPLFNQPTCMVLEDYAGNLLGARIAADGQWRFPQADSIPEKFSRAIVAFEDHRFWYHPGIDPVSLARAIGQNLRSGKVVSGGSTLTMQVIRMARGNKSRNLWQKSIEAILATRLELGYSKSEILRLYAAHAPFGGNVVGLDAASWRYFGKNPWLLSWAEAATLAVLPNSPALIHPGRNRQALMAKRNRLLDRLLEAGAMDHTSWELAKEEPLPDQPHPLPRLAPHLLDRAWREQVKTRKAPHSRIRTTLQQSLQRRVTEIASRQQQLLRQNGIHNLAAIVIEVETGNILAYVGNVIDAGDEHGAEVDVITARRSTGSILKPFLYALLLQNGQILPNSLIPDVPTTMSGYRPENYYLRYDGVVPARRALIRSLNVPFVRMLQMYGLEKFHFELKRLGFSTIDQPPAHYGLPLILGGAEATLGDITNAYACMSRMLGNYYPRDGRYDPKDYRAANYLFGVKTAPTTRNNLLDDPPFIGGAGAWFAFDAMQHLERPNAVGDWETFESSRRIAWKTGTSFGFRDAWAVGVTPRYAIGIWVGNADGEGRPGLMGAMAAAPALFEVLNTLPADGHWFRPPYDEMKRIPSCRKSGYRALDICPEVDSVWAPASSLKAEACPYHRTIHLDKMLHWQVNAECETPGNMVHQSWFVLPPLEEHYYKAKNPGYRTLPPFRADCASGQNNEAMMELIYPKQPTRIYVPINLDGQLSRTVFSVAHRSPETTIYWHIDNEYKGSTTHFHSMELNPPEGKHLLTLVDEKGNRLEQAFEIIGKRKN